MDKIDNIHTMEYYSVTKRNKVLTYVTIWINTENMPSEERQKQKDTLYKP